jgi:hypothetical protein
MKRVPAFAAGVAVVVATLLGVSSTALAQYGSSPPSSGGDQGWDVSIYPILAYVPVMGIDVRLPDAPPCAACPPATPDAHADSGLSGAAFVGFRVETRRVAVEGLFNYAGLDASNSSPFVDVSLKAYVGSIKGGFMLVKDLYAEAGARYTGLTVTAAVRSFPEVRWEPSRWDPLVGVTYHPRLASRWRLQSHLDWIGLGGDAYSAVSGQARLEWEPVRHFLITGGYGFSTERFNDTLESARFGNKDIHLDYTLHGPVVGLGLHF